MGQLGFQEIFIIFLIALLVFGPKKLPELGKSLGKGLREFKRATEDLKQNWEEQMREAETSVKDVKDIYANVDSDPSMTGPVYNNEESYASQPASPTEPVVPKEKV
jgi:TatA/E family protein of Tat protein translocase